MDTYRRGMHQQYGTSLREALSASSQQAALTGRSLTPEEVSAIAQGVLTPYLAPYGGGLEQAYEMDVEQQRYNRELSEEKELLKQEQKAQETAAVGQAGSAAIAGGMLYEQYYGGGAGASSSAGAGAGGTQGGGAGTGTTQAGAGGWGNAFAFVGGGAVGYAVSPYGQQIEEGTGGQSRIIFATTPGPGGSRRQGQRLGMMVTGAAGGYAATGGNPYGAAGGLVGGYMQENPETGKRGYQETYSYYIKPAWKGAAHDVRTAGRFVGGGITQPEETVKKILSPKRAARKAYRKVKNLF